MESCPRCDESVTILSMSPVDEVYCWDPKCLCDYDKNIVHFDIAYSCRHTALRSMHRREYNTLLESLKARTRTNK